MHMDEIVSKYQLESEKKSLVYIGNPQDNDAGYREWMSRYVLYSYDVTIVDQLKIELLREFWDYDYLIILGRDNVVNTLLTDIDLVTDEECIIVADLLSETP